jgi:2TM domain-containing protein
LEERTERSYAARTLGDLDALATDLPPIQPTAPATPAPGTVDLPPRMRPPGPRQVAAKATLLRTVVWFGTVSLVLIVIWALTGRDYFWPVWPILGFAIAIVWQAFAVWGPRPYDHDRRRPGR